MIRNFLLIGIGGAAGSMARYAITLLLPKTAVTSFPVSTLLVNLLGSLLIGLLAGVALRSQWMTQTGTALLAAGLCGGFTTFSAFALDGIRLLEAGAVLTALLYVSLSVVVGMVLCYAGYHLVS